eukprot:10058387-Heterocapsa_arctica.AAC.1
MKEVTTITADRVSKVMCSTVSEKTALITKQLEMMQGQLDVYNSAILYYLTKTCMQDNKSSRYDWTVLAESLASAVSYRKGLVAGKNAMQD